jgi:hypothetical protein
MLPTGQYALGLGQLANKAHLIYVTLIHLGKHGQKKKGYHSSNQ